MLFLIDVLKKLNVLCTVYLSPAFEVYTKLTFLSCQLTLALL